ncbi:NYN domain-containing protein [Candidatus Parcubacteria bacterium]|nr:NYN domain-containing protein [Candidatus Parcubacteria bacterium]
MRTKCLSKLVGRCQRMAVFIDGANLARMPTHLSGREEPERSIDFAKLRTLLNSWGRVTTLNYYTARDYDERVESFFRVLESFGYKVIHIATKTFRDGSRKGNLDPQIMIDTVKSLAGYDTAVIISGDGDFIPCVRYLQEEGKRVVVLSSQYGLAADLRESGAAVVYLDDLERYLTYLRPRR